MDYSQDEKDVLVAGIVAFSLVRLAIMLPMVELMEGLSK